METEGRDLLGCEGERSQIMGFKLSPDLRSPVGCIRSHMEVAMEREPRAVIVLSGKARNVFRYLRLLAHIKGDVRLKELR